MFIHLHTHQNQFLPTIATVKMSTFESVANEPIDLLHAVGWLIIKAVLKQQRKNVHNILAIVFLPPKSEDRERTIFGYLERGSKSLSFR
jgi:hypothetical protein